MLHKTILPPPSTPSAQDILDLSMDDAIPVRLTRRGGRVTFADLRLCVMVDFRTGVMGDDVYTAAAAVIARTDLMNLWPHHPHGWSQPFGQFLLELAPLLDNPVEVLARRGAATARAIR